MDTIRKHNFLSALVLTLALLCGVVGLGLVSVRAEQTGYTCNDLTVRKGPDKGWYTYNEAGEKVNYTGIAPNENGWWRVENGKVNFKATGVYYNENGWWRVENGKVNFDATGYYSNKYGWWYVRNGKVRFDYTGAKKGTINKTTAWWRVEKGKVNFEYKGVAKNEYGWWYFKDGRVDFSYTGVARNENGWWRIEDGKVNFGYNGIASNEYGSWYIVDGKVDFSYNGAIVIDHTMYVIEKGKVVLSEKLTVDALAPVRPTVRVTCYGAELSWNPVKTYNGKNIDGYEIYVKNSPTANYAKVATLDAGTTSYTYNQGSLADPGQNTRLYDVRAIRKNAYGIVVATSPENKQTALNNYLGGAFGISAPDIVSVNTTMATTAVTFKKVPYATNYVVYYGTYDANGNVASLSKAGSAKAEGSGAGSAADAKTGWVKGNQTISVYKQTNSDFITVRATYSEKAGNGYPSLSLESDYDTGFRLEQNQLKGQKILFLGDSLICGTPYGPSTADYTIPTRVSQQTGASVYNAGVGGATIVSDYPRIINNSVLQNQTMLLADGTYSKLGSDWKDVKDLSDFDIVVLEGGPNDFWKNVPLGNLDSTTKSEFYGALNTHLGLLKTASQARLSAGKERTKVVLVDVMYSPTGYSKNRKSLTYADYSAALKAVYNAYSNDPDIDIYFYDSHKSVLTKDNYKYETVDEVHPTAYRYGQLGNDMAAFLKSLTSAEPLTSNTNDLQ